LFIRFVCDLVTFSFTHAEIISWLDREGKKIGLSVTSWTAPFFIGGGGGGG
jgi:hypothetical protein